MLHSTAPRAPHRETHRLPADLWLKGIVSDSGLVIAAMIFGASTLLAPYQQGSLLWSVLVWSVYLADRMSGGPEDRGLARWPVRHPVLAKMLLCSLVGVIAGLVAAQPELLPATLGLGLLGCGYFLRVPLLGRRFKDIPGTKSLFLALNLCAGTVLLGGAPIGAGVASLGLILHANTTVYDLRDRERDAQAGVKTLAVLLPLRTLLASQGALVVAGMLLGLLHGGAFAAAGLGVGLAHLAAMAWLWSRPFTPALSVGLDGGAAAVFLVAAALS